MARINREIKPAHLLSQHGFFRVCPRLQRAVQEEKSEETGNKDGIGRG